MFEALLVIYTLGIGKGGDQGSSLTAIPFQSMAQCKEAVKHIEDVVDDWHYGKDKTKVVPILKSNKCFPITGVALKLPMPTHTYTTPAYVAPAPTECPPTPTYQDTGQGFSLPKLAPLPALN